MTSEPLLFLLAGILVGAVTAAACALVSARVRRPDRPELRGERSPAGPRSTPAPSIVASSHVDRPETVEEIEAQRARWARQGEEARRSRPDDLRAAAALFVRQSLEPSDLMTLGRWIDSGDYDQPERSLLAAAPLGWHFHGGMGVRNMLRAAGFSEQAWPEVLNLDDVYVEVLVDAWRIGQRTPKDWRDGRQGRDDLCPCDDHPPGRCETCRGACSCHWQEWP